MSIWGKLAGAAAGLAVGGPLGAVLGGLAGHLVVDWDSEPAAPDKQLAFTIGVIGLGAKMAKVDGHVTKDEVHAFKEVFRVPESERKNVARVFDLAKQDVAGFESYAKQLARLFHDDPEMLHNILEGLFYIAEADRVLQPTERDYLATVAHHFGIGDDEFRAILARHYAAERDSPYRVLGVEPAISDEDLHRHYRKLMVQNHPDKLMARGLPQEMIDIANKKIAAMNEAYDEIRKARLVGARV
ncbi:MULTISPECIES: TerB family tellurite resistance protein [Rhodomicrobium]|uniref:TerB family tellurite resistance protein n=1 Tax=Rhodomicrobium TaxID=1068 RepID=UPI000B4B0D52|nr:MULTISPECIES: TerB family tellurite resistance protein [Rhodomicrobium]